MSASGFTQQHLPLQRHGGGREGLSSSSASSSTPPCRLVHHSSPLPPLGNLAFSSGMASRLARTEAFSMGPELLRSGLGRARRCPFAFFFVFAVYLLCAALCLVAQLCPTLCDPLGCSRPGSSVHGVLQARILEWVAMPSSRGSFQPRDQTQVSHIAGRFFIV